MSEWISVKDRLPEIEIPVLLMDKFKYMEVGWVNHPLQSDLWQVCGCEMNENFITHWMPLPDPPQEEV
jgi:hypothetical protein